MGRFQAEPGATAAEMNLLCSILASSHRFVHAVMALEASPPALPAVQVSNALAAFTGQVTLTLALLARQLRGEKPLQRRFQIYERLIAIW